MVHYSADPHSDGAISRVTQFTYDVGVTPSEGKYVLTINPFLKASITVMIKYHYGISHSGHIILTISRKAK